MNDDVWPPRNLGTSDHWGRTIEYALDDLEERIGAVDQTTRGSNRQVAASTETIAENIEQTSELADDIEAAILTTPRYFVVPASRTNFALGDWQTIISQSIPAIDGFTRGEISARGTVYVEQDSTPVTDIQWPFDPSTVTSEFGPRPPLPYHNGIDFGQASGTPIPSASAGTVIVKAFFEDYGNYIRIDISDIVGVPGSWLGYAHLLSPSPLSVGDTVALGDTLGLVGSTGFSFGPHLHWETAPGGERIDPRIFMDIFGGTTSSGVLEVQSRISIGSSVSPAFKPYTEVGIGPRQQVFPVWGRSVTGLTVNDSVTVNLQVRSVGGKIPVDAANKATLTVRGGFQQ